ncbi:MAG: hypothetical protein ACOC7X_07270 [Spirochaetota bacterium]
MGLPLTLADYRHKKVLKRLQVTPVHPGLLLGIQFAVQTLMALLSAAQVLPLRQGIILLNGISNGHSFAAFWPQLVVLSSIAAVTITLSIASFRWDMEAE